VNMDTSTVPKVLGDFYRARTMMSDLIRPWTLTEWMFPLIPYFSLLVGAGLVSSPVRVVSLIVPFLLLFAAGYAFNARYDVHVDPGDKNPITRGAISKGKATFVAIAFLLASAISLFLAYTSVIVYLLFPIHLFLGFSYNDLKLRFKESPIGVFVAGLGFHTVPSLYILFEFGYFSNTALALIIFIFLTFTGREILHTLFDYVKDAPRNCQTFAVRLGRRTAWAIMHMLCLAGWIVILQNSVASGSFILQILSVLYGAGYLTLFAIQIVSYRLLHNFGFLWLTGRWPFFLTRLYLLLFSLVFLELSPLISLIVVWAFLTTKHY
jgi:4-hydroxybenzoate polyprenyltransferase